MARAQKRDAIHSQKFYFRKDVFPAGTSPLSTPLSSPHSSGCASPVEPHPHPYPNGSSLAPPTNGNGSARRKSRKLQNCFAEAPKPQNGEQAFGRVEDEYEEFSIEEIFTGKVSFLADSSLLALISYSCLT